MQEEINVQLQQQITSEELLKGFVTVILLLKLVSMMIHVALYGLLDTNVAQIQFIWYV